MEKIYKCSICGHKYNDYFSAEQCEKTCIKIKEQQSLTENYICPHCFSVNEYNIANEFNSTKFCRECGCACDERNLTISEVEYYTNKHKKFINSKEYELEKEEEKLDRLFFADEHKRDYLDDY